MNDRKKLKAHLAKYGMTNAERRRLALAFFALADLGSIVSAAMRDSMRIGDDVINVTNALRLLVDGPEGEFF